MARYATEAAAPVDLEEYRAQRAPPPGDTSGQRMPPAPISDEQRVAFNQHINEYLARIAVEHEIFMLRAEMDQVRKDQAGLLAMTAATDKTEAEIKALREERTRLVRLPEAVKKVSLVVLAFCLFTLANYALTGVAIVHPYFGTLVAAGSLVFFLIGLLMAKEDRLRDG